MLNSYWEEQDMSEEILEKHEAIVSSMGLPKWAQINCPFCDRKLKNREIRSIALKLNARNVGDVCVEFMCEACKKMDTVYFNDEAHTVTEFANKVQEYSEFSGSEPIVEEDMYKMNYNNLISREVM